MLIKQISSTDDMSITAVAVIFGDTNFQDTLEQHVISRILIMEVLRFSVLFLFFFIINTLVDNLLYMSLSANDFMANITNLFLFTHHNHSM